MIAVDPPSLRNRVSRGYVDNGEPDLNLGADQIGGVPTKRNRTNVTSDLLERHGEFSLGDSRRPLVDPLFDGDLILEQEEVVVRGAPMEDGILEYVLGVVGVLLDHDNELLRGFDLDGAKPVVRQACTGFGEFVFWYLEPVVPTAVLALEPVEDVLVLEEVLEQAGFVNLEGVDSLLARPMEFGHPRS